MEILPPLRQRAWGWPAAVNLILGGAGSGLYLLGVFISVFSRQWTADLQLISFRLLAPAIVGVGFLTLTLEAGKPSRAYRLFSNLPCSWMSVESLAGVIFILSSFISHFFPFTLVTAMAATAALVLMVSQGFMVYYAMAVNAWNDRIVPLLFVTSGLTGACGFFLLNTPNFLAISNSTAVIFLACITANCLVWLLYLFRAQDKAFKKAIKILKRPLILLIVVGMGHIIPGVCLLIVFFLGSAANVFLVSTVNGLWVGLLLIVGSAGQKGGIILAAGYYRRIVLESLTKKKKTATMIGSA